MNRYPWWANLLIALVLALGALYALPNLYGTDPALQISGQRGRVVDDGTARQVIAALKAAGVPEKASALADGSLTLRFADTDQQLKAQDAVRDALGQDYTVALNLVPAAPGWLTALRAQPMFLGLDLRGGVHFLMEVDTASAVRAAEERLVDDLRQLLREEKLRYEWVRRVAEGEASGVELRLRNADDVAKARALIARTHAELVVDTVGEDGQRLIGRLGDPYRIELRRMALQQNITTLRNRVNELGVAEPIVQQQGDSRIIVQLPGVQDTARAKEVLGATATLEFKLVDEEHDLAGALAGRVPPGSRLYPLRAGGQILIKDRAILTGEYITDAASGFDQQSGGAVVHVSLDARGAGIFERVTGENVGRRLAVVFIENKTDTVRKPDGSVERRNRRTEEVITAPVIQDRLGRRFQITGMDNAREARDLALLLRAGSLAAPLAIVEERTVGPSLGKENIDKGVRAVIAALALVVLFMAVRYRTLGLIANLALVGNLLLILALMSLLQATLTLPGIAGIVLTLGMAVDANVLINERIREERRNGNSPQASIAAGYERAFGTILDANITTLLAGLLLFIFGSGPVKGFAVTLSIGIVTTVFTAVFVTRAMVNLIQPRARRATAAARS
ncbi:MAG: protein translocase subunit SecD [Immundisolibacter sp.]|uniref:protein translocase subunit SecD n=1 Tax=Immundisolibacter sp. TaxID=1934948 RepID=UPI003D14B682